MTINLKSGAFYIGKNGIMFRTWKQLNALKQIWRESPNWHPTESLFDIINEI